MDGGLMGTHWHEAQAVLVAIEGMLDPGGPGGRLLELRGKLVASLER